MKGAAMGGGAVIASGATASAMALAGAPWWAITVVAAVLAVISATVVLASVLIPQDSQHRLEWWRDRRTHQAAMRRHARRGTASAGRS